MAPELNTIVVVFVLVWSSGVTISSDDCRTHIDIMMGLEIVLVLAIVQEEQYW
jgi:hypothetical protein